jgi:uncharacterized protein (UPF0335 family)
MLDTDCTVELRSGTQTTGKMSGKVFKAAVETLVKSKKGKARALPGEPPSPANDLKAFIERIERLEEEKAATAGDISEVYAEAKATGFNVKIMRKIVRLRSRDKTEIDEEAALLKLYAEKIGMQLELAF